MSWQREIFRLYAADRRINDIPGFRIEAPGDVARHAPIRPESGALLSFARFENRHADRRIREELDHVRNRGLEAEWKVHDFDEPPDIKARLESQGLKAGDVEALMVLDVGEAAIDAGTDADVTIETASGHLLDELAALQEHVWKVRLPWLTEMLREMTDPVLGTGIAFFARVGDRVAGTGWIDFPRGSRFAQLCGGAVLEEFRGRRIYSSLFARRVAEAKARAVPWIAVDAAPMSRPILERKGFRFVCHTYPMRTRPFDAIAVTRA